MTKGIVLALLVMAVLALAAWVTTNPQAQVAAEPYVRPVRAAFESLLNSLRPTGRAFTNLVDAIAGLGDGLRTLWLNTVAGFAPAR
jgi:hypothetical protein